MKKLFLTFLVLLLCFTEFLFAQPKSNFEDISIKNEINPSLLLPVFQLAESLNLPVEIYIPNTVMCRASGIENGKIIYSVITDFTNPYNGAFCAFYDEILNSFDLSRARIIYANGRSTDNTGEQILIKQRNPHNKVYLIPCTSRRSVWAFDFNTGDLVDTAFIPYSSPLLQTPRKALQLSKTQVLVADQLSDVVQLFDTSGAYIKIYCPSTGLNNAILDNIRDVEFRANGNILVTNAGTAGNAQNTVQQFDHDGVFLNTFASDSINSPFNMLFRTGDLLLSNSSGIHDVIKLNLNNGSFLGDFLANELNFPQQMIGIENGKVAVCEFSGVLSGIRIYDSTGVLLDTLKGATGLRGVWKLPNGNYITTNSVGVYEINGINGTLVRTIVSGLGFSCISVFDPNFSTGIYPIQGRIPDELKLFNNYPNPFNPITKIKFQVSLCHSCEGRNPHVILNVFDILGKEVATLVNESLQPGTYEIPFNAATLPSGIYFYRLSTYGFSETKKMILMK